MNQPTLDHNALTEELMSCAGLEEAARILSRHLEDRPHWQLHHPSGDNDGPQFWLKLRREVHALLCTDDPRYEPERRQLSSTAKPAVATLTAFAVNSLGLEQGLAASFAALALILPLKITRNVWCQSAVEKSLTDLEREQLEALKRKPDKRRA